MTGAEIARAPVVARASVASVFGDFTHWLDSHRATLQVAGLVAFAGPTTFLAGALSVMEAPDTWSVVTLAALFAFYGGLLWLFLLLAGYALCRHNPRQPVARAAFAFILACLAVVAADTATAPQRARINLEQGVVKSRLTMQLYSVTFSLAMAMLFFAHLGRSRAHEAAAGRLGSAQVAQRTLRRRAADARLKALQARIDPQLLFEILDDVRRCYETDPLRAERGLDELVAFLRAALPRVRRSSSSVALECELAGAYVRIRSLLRGAEGDVAIRIAVDAVDATFPPGILVPLLDDAMHLGAGSFVLEAAGEGTDCCLVVRLPVRPSVSALARAEAVLLELYDTSGAMRCLARADGGVEVSIRIPNEAA